MNRETYRKTVRILLGITLSLIGLNALGGGYYGMAGAENVPLEWLKGSPFKSYFFPSLFLFIVIGGICFTAAVAVFKNSGYAKQLSVLSAILLWSWIIIQVIVIGYVSWMQPAIFISGILILVLTFVMSKLNKLNGA